MAAAKPREHRDTSTLMTGRKATPLQEDFAEASAMGLQPQEALSRATHGEQSSPGTAKNLATAPPIIDLINRKKRANAIMLGLTRDKVLQGMMDAVDQAKLIADPMSQIAGWREIAKVCGFYAPEVKRIELDSTAKNYLDRMAQLPDDELLRIAQGDLIEGEVTGEVTHDSDPE